MKTTKKDVLMIINQTIDICRSKNIQPEVSDLETIKDFTKAMQERAKGRWIYRVINGKAKIECSNCGKIFDLGEITLDSLKEQIEYNNFCHRCGADMRIHADVFYEVGE